MAASSAVKRTKTASRPASGAQVLAEDRRGPETPTDAGARRGGRWRVDGRFGAHAASLPASLPSAASCTSECFRPRGGRARGAEPAAAHDRDAVADAEQLGQVARHQRTAFAALAGDELVDERVDLRLAADVDAAGRLVEEEHVDVVVQEARERDLLLVAAGELADGWSGPWQRMCEPRRSSARVGCG